MPNSTRAFHLHCMGPLDPSVPAASRLAQLSGFISDPATIRDILLATPDAPRSIRPARPTLPDAHALDSALLAVGIFSHVCYVDSFEPRVARVFIDQREGPRRTERAPVTPVDQRSNRGRRAVDMA